MRHTNILVGMSLSLMVACDGSVVGTMDASSFWEPTRGPYGGCLSTFAGGENGEVYAGGSKQYFYRSMDRGRSWKRVGSPSTGFSSVIVTSSGRLLAATSKGLEHSLDRGESWARTSLAGFITVLATGAGGSVLVSGWSGGLMRSLDDGTTWTSLGLTHAAYAVAEPTRGILVAGTHDGIYVSHDDGASWALAPGTEGHWLHLVVGDEGNIYASGQRLLRSTDAGRTWTVLFTPSGWVGPILVSKNGLFVSLEGSLMRSLDAGETWEPVLVAGDGRAVPVGSTADGQVYAQKCRVEGVFRSVDGGLTWHKVRLPFVVFAGLEVDSHGRLFAATGEGLQRSSDAGATWQHAGPGPVGVTFMGPRDELWMVAADSLFLSRDGGSSWSPRAVRLDSDPQRRPTYFAVDGGGDLYAGSVRCDGGPGPCDARLYRSDDEGVSWTPTNLSVNGVIAAGDRGHVLVGAQGAVFVSRDGGDTWAERRLPIEFTAVVALRIGPGGEAAAGTSSGIFVSVDGGDTWSATDVTAQIPVLTFAPDGTLVAAGHRGVYIGRPGRPGEGAWTHLQDDIGGIVRAFAVGVDGHLYAGVNGGSVVRSRRPL